MGLALALSVYEVLLNALSGERFGPVWWASLSLRLATFALLAAGCVWTVVRELGRVERYSEVELALRFPDRVRLVFGSGVLACDALDAGDLGVNRDGTPGPNYWQNHSVHDIAIKVAPPGRTVIVTLAKDPSGMSSLVFCSSASFMSKVMGVILVRGC